jgi:serine/threonine-protein kinase
VVRDPSALGGRGRGLLAEAFAADPRLADDLNAGWRHTAARFAALAGSGWGEDAGNLAATERGRWRRQALDWLRADLAASTRLLEGGRPGDAAWVRQQLQRWQREGDLAGLRDVDAVAQLPADEQQACRRLWADIAALQQRGRDPKVK